MTNGWISEPELERYYWFFRRGFSLLPEVVYVLAEPVGCLQTEMGRLSTEDGDMFYAIEEPAAPKTIDEAA